MQTVLQYSFAESGIVLTFLLSVKPPEQSFFNILILEKSRFPPKCITLITESIFYNYVS